MRRPRSHVLASASSITVMTRETDKNVGKKEVAEPDFVNDEVVERNRV